MKPLIIFPLILISSLIVNAQTIKLEFPHFAGKTYEFKIFQGDKHITLSEDTINNGGKVELVLPDEYKDYKGMAQWYLTNNKTGGGLDLIINNENFYVSCLDSIPTNENIVYSGSKENSFDKINYKKQQNLFEKHDAILSALRAYSKDEKLYHIFDTEYKVIVKDYDLYSKALTESKLYAAKFRQIVNLTRGIGTSIITDEFPKAININKFIVNELDFAFLYTSNHWGNVIYSWVQLNTLVLDNDINFLSNAKIILKRLPTDKIYTDFVISFTKAVSRTGKDYILAALTDEIKNSKRLLHYDGVLNIYKQDLTGKAPDLFVTSYNGSKEGNNKITSVLKTDTLQSKFTLLVFYRSGCGPCEETMAKLTENYFVFKSKNFRIISIAADTDEKVFNETSAQHPWSDKFCDFEGDKGINFINYGVISTPTFYIINKEGNILSKMATISDLLKFVEKQ